MRVLEFAIDRVDVRFQDNKIRQFDMFAYQPQLLYPEHIHQ